MGKANCLLLLALYATALGAEKEKNCYNCIGKTPDECKAETSKSIVCPGQCIMVSGMFSDDVKYYERNCIPEGKDACEDFKKFMRKTDECQTCSENNCNKNEFKS